MGQPPQFTGKGGGKAMIARALLRRLYPAQARRKVQGRGVDMVSLAPHIWDMIFLLKSLRCHLSVQNVFGRNNACAGQINALAGLAAEFSKTPLQSLKRLWFGFFEETDLRHGGSFFPHAATFAMGVRI